MQILVVDDSHLMRRYVARTLKMTGIEVSVHEAANGRDAIDQALRIHPDLIITDLHMPEMSGEELVARVSGDPGLSGTPMLVISADHCPGRPEALIHVGAVAYLTKPVAPETLRDRLLGIIASRNLSGQTLRADKDIKIPPEVIRSAVSRMLEEMCYCESTWAGQGLLNPPAIGAKVSFSGALSGEFRVSATRRLATQLAAEFLAADVSTITDVEATAFIHEFANVACGATLSDWMPEVSFNFSVPSGLTEAEAGGPWPHCCRITDVNAELAVEVVCSAV
jgi:CheY-like chemotaxis protein